MPRPLSDKQLLELDLELPAETWGMDDAQTDTMAPMLRLVFFAGYVLGNVDAIAGRPWALAHRIAGKS